MKPIYFDQKSRYGDTPGPVKLVLKYSVHDWQAFGGGKNGHETFRQTRIYNFSWQMRRFARNLKFSNLTQ